MTLRKLLIPLLAFPWGLIAGALSVAWPILFPTVPRDSTRPLVYEARFCARTGEGTAVRERDEMQREWRYR